MSLRRWLRFALYSLRAIGPWVLLRNTFRLAADPAARTHDSGFDGRYGTDTTQGVTPVDAELPDARQASATMYLPTMDVDLEAMIDALGWTAAQIRDAAFVDIGSGKGRVVMLAAMRPFREVVGVELSPVLHAIAETNVAHIGAHGALAAPVRLVLEDAATAALPDGPLVVYLYHPFREDIAAQLLGRLVASLVASPRPVAIIYGHPTLQRCLAPSVFEAGGVFRKATEGARATRSFKIGWSIWTNLAWLDVPRARAA